MRIVPVTRYALALLFLLAALSARATTVTIDFEDVTPQTNFRSSTTVESKGYIFEAGSNFCTSGSSGVSAAGIFVEAGRTEPYLCGAGIYMTRADNGAFAIHSLDAVSMADTAAVFVGTLWGGGDANLGSPVGTGDWLNLVSLRYSSSFQAGFYDSMRLDNITVSAVPIPAAAWLFASGLGALTWIRRRKVI